MKKIISSICSIYFSMCLLWGVSTACAMETAVRATLSPNMQEGGLSGAVKKGISTFREDEHREGGIVFRLKKNAETFRVAEGRFDNITVDTSAIRYLLDDRWELNKDEKAVAKRKKREIEHLLSDVKKKLLKKPFFNEKDFACTVSIEYGMYKSIVYERKKKNNYTPHISINWHCFRDNNFLLLEIEHVLMADKMKQWFPEVNPALRELYCVLDINIRGMLQLKWEDNNGKGNRVPHMLNQLNDVAHPTRGLYPRYAAVMNEPHVNIGEFFDSIVLMLSSDTEKTYFSSIRNHMKTRILNDNGEKDISKRRVLFQEWKELQERVRQKRTDGVSVEVSTQVKKPDAQTRKAHKKTVRELEGKEQQLSSEVLIPLVETRGEVPTALSEFLPFAERVHYKIIDSHYVYIRVNVSAQNKDAVYAHIMLGVKDHVGGQMGKGGHLFGQTLKKWKNQAPDAFWYAHDGIVKDKEIRRDQLLRNYSLSQLATQLAMGNNDAEEACKKQLRKLCKRVYGNESLGKHTLNAVRREMLRKKMFKKNVEARTLFILIERAYINPYMARTFPTLLGGEYNPYGRAVKDLAIWPVSDDAMTNYAHTLSWMMPKTSIRNIPERYRDAYKASITNILMVLDTLDAHDTFETSATLLNAA